MNIECRTYVQPNSNLVKIPFFCNRDKWSDDTCTGEFLLTLCFTLFFKRKSRIIVQSRAVFTDKVFTNFRTRTKYEYAIYRICIAFTQPIKWYFTNSISRTYHNCFDYVYAIETQLLKSRHSIAVEVTVSNGISP